jgi:hypothetical protein
VPLVLILGSAPNGTGDNGFLFEVNGTYVAETPVPAALPLFATGLGTLCLMARRRQRKQAG